MAFADVVKTYYSAWPNGGMRVEEIAALYTDQTTASNGEWISTAGVTSINFVVNGITTGQVDFRGWNGDANPGAAEHGEAVYGLATSGTTKVALLTADGTISFRGHNLPKWFKCYPSDVTNVSLDVDMKRVRVIS